MSEYEGIMDKFSAALNDNAVLNDSAVTAGNNSAGGHARYSTTIDIYTHVMGVTFEEEADKFAAPVVDCATEFPDLTKIKSA